MEDLVMVGKVALRPSEVLYVKGFSYSKGTRYVKLRNGSEISLGEISVEEAMRAINNRGAEQSEA